MIKKILENLKDSFKKYITNHIGTNIVLLMIALAIIIVDLDNPTDFIPRLFTTLFLTGMFALLGETYTKINKKRYIIYPIGFIVSIFISKCILEEELSRYLIGIITTIGFSIIYLMINNSKETTNKYLTNTITNLLKLGIIASVLNIGVISIIGLISTLLVELNEIVFVKTEIIVLVLYYIPALIISLETKPEENKFIYSLINYVALPLVSIATTIIYIYILKLLITLKLPHTQTFTINTILLSCGIPIVLMALSYDKDTIMMKIANILRKLYIPFVILQIFALSLRIYAYGITTSRYFGVILIILGIISMILLNKNNGKNYKYILLACALISIISFILPYVNIYEYPNYMQINRLKQILPEGKEFETLSEKEKENVKSIYYYVHNAKYYPSYLPQEELQNLIWNYTNNEDDNYIYYDSSKERINIAKYKEIEKYSVYSNEEFMISINNQNYDLKDYCKKLYLYNKENIDIEEYIEKNSIIVINDKMDLYITNLSLNYSNNYIIIDGYILYK